FANSAGGYVVFGIDKTKKLDAGVPLRLGRTDITDAVSKRIADNLQPHLHGYRVHAITLPKYHKPDRCILVLQLPLTESRPHWVKGGNEPCYIRVDRHSLPMPRQTFLDMKTRGTASVAVISTLGLQKGPTGGNVGEVQYWYAFTARLDGFGRLEHFGAWT